MSFSPLNPGLAGWMHLGLALTRMNVAASEVIVRRSVLMAQGRMSAAELVGMVAEKGSAMASSAERAMVLAARGATPARIASGALRPYGTKARSNVRKLRG